MKTVLEELPGEAHEVLKQFLSPSEEILLTFFSGSWTMDQEPPNLDAYLKDYELVIATPRHLFKLPKKWLEQYQARAKEWLFSQDGLVKISLSEVISSEIERYMQCSNVVIRLPSKEVRIDKCQHLQAEKLFRILESQRKKVGEAGERVEMLYPIEKGQPVAFQVFNTTEDGETLHIMFVKQTASAHLPPSFSILQYKNGKLVKEFAFEPKKT